VCLRGVRVVCVVASTDMQKHTATLHGHYLTFNFQAFSTEVASWTEFRANLLRDVAEVLFALPVSNEPALSWRRQNVGIEREVALNYDGMSVVGAVRKQLVAQLVANTHPQNIRATCDLSLDAPYRQRERALGIDRQGLQVEAKRYSILESHAAAKRVLKHLVTQSAVKPYDYHREP